MKIDREFFEKAIYTATFKTSDVSPFFVPIRAHSQSKTVQNVKVQ